MQKIKITNSKDSVTIDIEGTIGVPEQWQFDEPQQRVATYETFRGTLQQIEALDAQSIIVNIRSTGGDVNDALLIYEALSSLSAKITTRCYGYVASAATVIAQAASEGLREISPNALYLVHNSQCAVEGTADALSQRIELLRKTDEGLAELYARRSGKEAAVFAELMAEENGAGRWLSAEETIANGLADKLIEGQAAQSEMTTESAEESEDEEEKKKKKEEQSKEQEESIIAKAVVEVRGMISRLGERLGLVSEIEKESQNLAQAQHPSKAQVIKPLTTPATPSNAKIAESTLRGGSQIALSDGQSTLKRSRLLSSDDPSLQEARMSANQSAYEQDARRLRSKY